MRIGVDLGGTKIEAIAIDRDGRERGRRRVPTPRDRYAATLAAITTLVEGLEREGSEPARVGIGIPGALSPATGLGEERATVSGSTAAPFARTSSASSTGPSASRTTRTASRCRRPGTAPARGRAPSSASSWEPAPAAASSSTAASSTGPNAIAGEWGHNPLPWPRAGEWPGAPCYCGRTGCVETFLSGPGVSRDHLEVTGEGLDAATIATRAADGDERCEATLARYEERLDTGAGRRRQPPRPGRDRARRRPLEPHPALRASSGALGGLGVRRSASRPRSARPSTAIRAASGERRGSGRRPRTTDGRHRCGCPLRLSARYLVPRTMPERWTSESTRTRSGRLW